MGENLFSLFFLNEKGNRQIKKIVLGGIKKLCNLQHNDISSASQLVEAPHVSPYAQAFHPLLVQ